MLFTDFQKRFVDHSKSILEYGNLFILDVDPDTLWNVYLESIPAEYNPIYRQRREHDCSCCRHFVRHAGMLVAIDENYQPHTLWDFDTHDKVYQPMLNAMRAFLRQEISRAFFTKEDRISTPVSYETLVESQQSWHHLYLDIPRDYVVDNPADAQEKRRVLKQMFRDACEEIKFDAFVTVLELIDEGLVYRGDEYRHNVELFLALHHDFNSQKDKNKDRYAWRVSGKISESLAKIKGSAIGTLLADLSKGLDVDDALKRWENVTAPANYKRPKTAYTKKHVEEARAKIVELGLEDSLGRRFAQLGDITVNNVLWLNRNVGRIETGRLTVFDQMMNGETINPKTLERCQIVSIDALMNSLDDITSIEILLENRHQPNLVSLIAPKVDTAPSLFKWPNAFSWAYEGNLADSNVKTRVKEAGGNVSGELCCRLAWQNTDDLDFHMREPNYEIYYLNKRHRSPNGGILDVDANGGDGIRSDPCENIVYNSISNMKNGTYNLFVRQYSRRENRNYGFHGEIEILGNIYEFSYEKPMPTGTDIAVADIYVNHGEVKIKMFLDGNVSLHSTKIWNLDTLKFHPVSVIMHSPNYWDKNEIGNKHHFFMLKDCINPGMPNGFYNEYLPQEFMSLRKVFEALGFYMKVEPSMDQLSGLGFSSTLRNYIFARLNNKQIVKVQF